MKVYKNISKNFEYSVSLADLEDHPEMTSNTKNGEVVIERIELCYNKSTDKFYISNYYAAPSDSYGTNWYISDSGCLSYNEEELDILISELIKLKKSRKDVV
jgi:hypothetical protein